MTIDPDTPSAGTPAPSVWRLGGGWLRRHRLVAGAAAVVVLATAVVVPVTLADPADATPCRHVPASTRGTTRAA
ncbi:hypothetical protein [Streptomyces sp. NPDC016845]|uniref:hypothetical protein n=1 Tax=Streptomyces sp. NPDC016845 TaxID=3364972 RepID=UPI00379086D0